MRFIAGVFLAVAAVLFMGQISGNLFPIDIVSTNSSVVVTTGLTYQTVLTGASNRKSLTIQNNAASGTDVCYLLFGSNVTVVPATTTTGSTSIISGSASVTAAQASIVLTPGQSYTRYFPAVPSDTIYGTCTNSGDSIYVDVQ